MKLLFLATLFPLVGYNQQTSDLSLHISTLKDNRIGLEYRIPFKEKAHVNFGINYGGYGSSFISYKVVSSTDSSFIERHSNSNMSIGSVRFGMERQIKETIFSLGFDVLAGYGNLKVELGNVEYIKDSLNNWGGVITYPFDINNPSYAQSTQHYFIPGIQLNGKMDLPINEHFGLNLTLGYNVNAQIYNRQTNGIDPYEEFTGLNGRVMLNANLYSSIGLRYKFN